MPHTLHLVLAYSSHPPVWALLRKLPIFICCLNHAPRWSACEGYTAIRRVHSHLNTMTDGMRVFNSPYDPWLKFLYPGANANSAFISAEPGSGPARCDMVSPSCRLRCGDSCLVVQA